MPAIVVENLVKDYGTLRAVDGLSFTVEQGEVVALLGPNGAGKSTAVEILEGHRTRTSGQVTVMGADPATGGAAFRDRIGIVLQECGIERELTITETLDHYGACYTRTRPRDEVLALAGLTDLADRRTHQLSGGQKRRIDLALGLIGDPDLLFLDEPTTGFDPSARRQAWDMVRGLRTLGTTILLTSHYMDEVEALADRVLVINQGKLVAQGTPDELRAGIADTTLVRFDQPANGGTVQELFGELTGTATAANNRVEIRTTNPTGDLHRLTDWALKHDQELGHLEVTRPTLEDVYLNLIGGTEDE